MAPNVEGFAVLLRTLIVVACMASGLLPLVEGADTTINGGETRVIDGDTLEAKGERVRLQGIDAPEKGQSCESASGKRYPCGQEAIRALPERIGESKVACAIDAQRDRYGRALGVCSLQRRRPAVGGDAYGFQCGLGILRVGVLVESRTRGSTKTWLA